MNLNCRKLGAVALSAFILSAAGARDARAQLAQDDIVLGRSEATSTYRVYDQSAGTWSPGPGWAPNFMQSTEFDNAGLVSHNASGNLFAANFGNAWTGFEFHNLATDGTSSSTSAWSIVEAQGGTIGQANPPWRSERGGGLSASPFNSYVAWANFDNGSLWVHNYLQGTSPGSGGAVSITGPRESTLGDGNGGAGSLTALKVGATQGTAWLNDWTLIAFNGFGELVQWDISGVAGGSEDGTIAGFQPTLASNWQIANNEVSFDGQFTDIEYNPEIDPDHIYASVTKSDFSAELFAYDYDSVTGAITLNTSMTVPNAPNGDPREPREIAFDSQGNLYYSGYAGSGSDNIVMKFNNATDIVNWDESDIDVFYNHSDYTGFNGLDVATSANMSTLIGDADNNGIINSGDADVVAQNWDPTGSEFHAYWEGDFNRDGRINSADADFVSQNWAPGGYSTLSTLATGPAHVSAVPEPSAMLLCGMGVIGLLVRRRTAG